jgi:hypothetical protein
MADAPEVHGTPTPHAGGIKGFMTNNTAGMPNWVWLLVIAGGIGLALGVKYFYNKKPSSTTGADTSGLGLAIDPTTGLPYAVAGLVPAGGISPGPPQPVPPPTPAPFTWPTSLSGMKIWEGTQSHDFFFGPNGPQPGRANQTLLSTLFPAGTTFSDPGGGKAGDAFYYTLPGTTTPVKAPVTLVNPLPPGGGGGESGGGPGMMVQPQELLTSWPGDTSQVRMTG